MTDIILAGVGTILGMFWFYLMIKGFETNLCGSVV